MSRRAKVIVAAAAFVFIAGGFFAAYGLLWQEEPVVETPEAREVADALAGYGDDAAALLPVGADDQLVEGIRAALPPGTTIVADAEHWAPNGLGGGTVPPL
jgi:hypothetical protein